jgi:hypothetical protein
VIIVYEETMKVLTKIAEHPGCTFVEVSDGAFGHALIALRAEGYIEDHETGGYNE